MLETWLSAERAIRESRTGRLEQLVLTKKKGKSK